MDRKAAIITGASRGIGARIAVRLAADGCDVVLCCHSNIELARQVAAECAGVQTHILTGDCSDPAVCGVWVASCLEKFGRVDILVNNAGKTHDGLLMRMTNQQFDDVLSTNLNSAFYLTRAVCRPMMKQRFGRIINLSSVAGVYGNAGQANYSASKAGLIGLTKSSAKELAGRGITVNAIAPGLIETEMTANMPENERQKMIDAIGAGRMGRPEEIAAIASFLASEDAGYITGQVIVADGGLAF